MKLGFIVLFVALITFLGCSDTVEVKEREPAIYGIVKDTLGNPIADADIVLLFDIIPSDKELAENGLYIAPNPANQYTSFRFPMTTQGKASLNLYDPVLKKNLVNLIDEELNAGMHEFQFSLVDYENENKIIRNGIYELRLVRNGDLSSAKLTVLSLIPTEVSATVKTDSAGQFVVSYDYIQLYEAVMRTNEIGQVLGKFELSDMIEIFAIKNDAAVAYYQLKVDKSKVEDIVVQGPKK